MMPVVLVVEEDTCFVRDKNDRVSSESRYQPKEAFVYASQAV